MYQLYRTVVLPQCALDLGWNITTDWFVNRFIRWDTYIHLQIPNQKHITLFGLGLIMSFVLLFPYLVCLFVSLFFILLYFNTFVCKCYMFDDYLNLIKSLNLLLCSVHNQWSSLLILKLADQMLNDSLERSYTTNTTGMYVDPKVNGIRCFA